MSDLGSRLFSVAFCLLSPRSAIKVDDSSALQLDLDWIFYFDSMRMLAFDPSDVGNTEYGNY